MLVEKLEKLVHLHLEKGGSFFAQANGSEEVDMEAGRTFSAWDITFTRFEWVGEGSRVGRFRLANFRDLAFRDAIGIGTNSIVDFRTFRALTVV